MIKTVKISKDQSLTLSNNIVWLLIYRDQFGRDIVPTIVPALNAGIDLVFALYKATGGKVTKEDILSIDPDELTSALWSLSGLEAVDLLNIIWAMAKNADDTIEDPRTFFGKFDKFPLDLIMPAVFELLYTALISGKNLKRLQEAISGLKPLNLTK